MDFDFPDIFRRLDDLVWVLILVAGLLRRVFRKAKPRPESAPESPLPDALDEPPVPEPPQEVRLPERASLLGAKLRESARTLETRAAKLAEAIAHERANRRFLATLTDYVPKEIARLRGHLGTPALASLGQAVPCERWLNIVLDQTEELVRQRRNPKLAAELGDADVMAEGCYGPIIAFAKAEGLGLTTGNPATQVGDFDLSIWTSFIPTSIAPIFLPRDFFTEVFWWPALAHEIGHDFLASIPGLDAKLRTQLRLASEASGSRPLAFGPRGLTVAEVTRVFGAWFEELFCDVFGTLMCGPAYAVTMKKLFARVSAVEMQVTVEMDESGRRYDCHPPRHIRFLIACMVLERQGFANVASRLRGEWQALHGELDRILFPIPGQFLAIPLEIFESFAHELVSELLGGQLAGLNGFGLTDISGLDFGPHEYAEAERARAALAILDIPAVRDVRAIIAGAVLAAEERPDSAPLILARARRAIPAMGTAEVRPDAYSAEGTPKAAVTSCRGPVSAVDRQLLSEALVWRELIHRRGKVTLAS